MSDETTTETVEPQAEPVELPVDPVEAVVEDALERVRPPNTLSIDVEVPHGDSVECKTIYFRPLNVVPMGIIRKTRKDPNEQMWAVFEWAMAEDDLALFDEMPLKELQDIQERMANASEVDLGKLPD
jgi:hypothetical protein